MATGASVGIRITGLRETQRALKRYGVSAEELKQAMQNTSHKAVADAQALTPVRTGALQRSIRGNKAQAKAVISAGSKKIYYASYVEYGAEHNSPVEMITKAVEDNQEYMVHQIEKELDSLAKKYDLN